MPPKKDKSASATHDADIIAELRILTQNVEKIRNTQDQIVSKQDQIAKLVDEVARLKEDNARKDAVIVSLERRIDDLEQYSRKDNLIVSGLDIRPLSYARAASSDEDRGGEEAPEHEMLSTEDKVVHFLESRDIDINRDNVSSCHLLGGRGNKNHPPRIILRFSNRKEKASLLKQGRKLQNTNVYLNDDLTHKNAQIAKHARKLRYDGDITDTWVRNCAVLIRLKDKTVKKISQAQDFATLGLPELSLNHQNDERTRKFK